MISHVQGIASSKALVDTKLHSSMSPVMANDKAEHALLNTHLSDQQDWRTCMTAVSTHTIKRQRFTVLCKANFRKITTGARNYYMNYLSDEYRT